MTSGDGVSDPARPADPGADAEGWPFPAEYGGGWVRYRRRRRIRAAVGLAAVVVVLAAAATAAAGWGLGARQAQQPAASTLPPATATVTRATLTQTEQVRGTLGYGAASTVVARMSAAGSAGQGGGGTSSVSGAASGSAAGGASAGKPTAGDSTAPTTTNTLTWLPPVGSIVRPGQAVYRVDNQPVVLLAGHIPMYRALTTGLHGPDVAMLEENLRAFGYDGFTVDSAFTSATARAVRRWQRNLGVPRTGTVDVNQVVVAPGRLRVTGHPAALGADAVGEVLTYTGTTRVVTVPLEVTRQHLVRVGLTATVTLPDGRTVTGRVVSIGTVATSPGDGGDGTPGGVPMTKQDGQASEQGVPTVQVLVSIANQAALGRLDAAPVQLSLVSSRRPNVLTVPVGALVALAEGGYGVQVVEGTSARYVAVRTGMFADGRVEVAGRGIRMGMTVGVPA